jgi:uncharacterized protein
MDSLQVLCLSDGRPGHEKQSRAVLAALGSLTTISQSLWTLHHTSGVGRIIQGLQSIFAASATSLQLPRSVDLIIGTGSTTHLPMVGLKMRTGAKLVTCMSPDPWLKPWFDLCLIPRHDRPAVRNKHFATYGPPCLAPDPKRRDPCTGLILVGGVDEKSHDWDSTYFISQIKALISLPDIRWTMASSGRTPSDTIDQLRKLENSSQRVMFYTDDETPRGWIETAYATHGQVWVTADSVSMVYEALTAGCRVGVLPVKWKRTGNKFQDGIDDLHRHAMIVGYDQWLEGAALPEAATPLNEAQRCAEEILRRWWPNRLNDNPR